MMLPVATHYHFLANRYPGAGGLYNYVKYIFGYDRAFLAGWFMFLIYIAIFWANALLCDHFKHSPVFRVGGDEFVVLLEGRDFESKDEIMKNINKEIEENIGRGKVVISLGLAKFDRESDASFHEVFKRADGLMYGRKLQLKSMGAAARD